ncbi:MAG: hypothetical protein JEZ06_08005 [Anaerolineaceae bacterium]|nr:hypothetical protein [Anaerolineaceae bacterium]
MIECFAKTVISVVDLREALLNVMNRSYRLTDADYSNGDSYRYTYDAVGNRLTQETADSSNTYTYDTAREALSNEVEGSNPMTSVDGTANTWDANGNMLSDGTSIHL